jgi:exodeoxyribonuclease VII small subunit
MAEQTDQAEPRIGDIDRLSFDDALAELQRTVAELEAGGQPLERSIALYERGAMALHERCAQLGEASSVKQLVTPPAAPSRPSTSARHRQRRRVT